MPLSPTSTRGFWSETARFLPGALVLCLASLTSGGLGALIAVRLLYEQRAPTFWQLLLRVFSHAVGR